MYSPEKSDTQRFGDWQTKVAIGLMLFAATVLLYLFGFIR